MPSKKRTTRKGSKGGRKKPSKKTKRTERRSKRIEGTPSFDFGLDLNNEQKKIDPNKIPKVKLIGILSRRLSTNQIYRSLIRLGKHRLAENFLSEIEFVNRKYDKMLLEIEGKREETIEDEILNVVVDRIVSHMRRLYSMSFKPRNEYDFHKQIEPFLNGLISVMETSLTKFGWKTNVYREYKLPSNERIDLMILIGRMKIGIEVKYDLKEKSKLQRLLGQIDEYIPYMDLLIIISYYPLNTNVINAIKNKEIEKGKLIKIVIPNKVI